MATVGKVVDLGAGDERYRDDHGAADPAVAAALADYAAGTCGEHAVLAALAVSRLLVPVVAVLGDETPGSGHASEADGSPPAPAAGGEKSSEMALPEIVGRDGRRALPAFTCITSLQRWRPGARPVPVPAAGVWQSGVQDCGAVVIDIAGPVPLVVEGSRLAALAAGTVPGMHQDADVWRQVAAAAATVAPGLRVRLSEAGPGLDFTIELAPPAGSAGLVPEPVAASIADGVHQRLADRIRGGIAVVRRPG